eukprot:1188841-Prorocentrum_minimum.AAC.1
MPDLCCQYCNGLQHHLRHRLRWRTRAAYSKGVRATCCPQLQRYSIIGPPLLGGTWVGWPHAEEEGKGVMSGGGQEGVRRGSGGGQEEGSGNTLACPSVPGGDTLYNVQPEGEL